jgi:hypothetical protein
LADDDLVAGLYVVTHNAFTDRCNQRLQFTCPINAFRAMFLTLKAAGLIDRTCAKNGKVAAICRVLGRGRLIKPLAGGRWYPARGKGIGKKYGLGGPIGCMQTGKSSSGS